MRRVGPKVFFGRLHHCKKTQNTDDGCEPVMDDDENFIQYCFLEPEQDLGHDRLFIEFDVMWDEWLNDAIQRGNNEIGVSTLCR